MGTVTQMEQYEHLRGLRISSTVKDSPGGSSVSSGIPQIDVVLATAQQFASMQRAIMLTNLNLFFTPFGFEVRDMGIGIFDLYHKI